jgi:hypothetical protein
MEIVGGCLCKAVRYRCTAPPLTTRVCWCRNCQYLGCGNATINVCFPSEAVIVEGQVTDYVSVADSGNVMHRKFCASCGTQLFSGAEARPHLLYIRAGTLDNPEIARPSMTIWTALAPSWAVIDAGLPSLEGQAPPAAPAPTR